MSTNAGEESVHLSTGQSPSLIDGPHAIYSLLLPPTKPSPATKYPATASAPWETTAACAKDRPVKWPTIEWINPGRWITGCSHIIPIWTIAPIRYSAETSSSTRHRTLTHWSCSVKSWHSKHLLLDPETILKQVQHRVQDDKLELISICHFLRSSSFFSI